MLAVVSACRRDLLDVSPALTEAAGAIIDVKFCSLLFLFSSVLFFKWF